VIPALVGRNDVAIVDMYDHASIMDGCRLSFGEVKKYRHNDMDALERVLEACKEKAKLIIVDGVFSMEGDLADLPAIVRLAKAYGARIMVDDAHGIGVLGKGGRGTAEHLGLKTKSILSWNLQQIPCGDRRLCRRSVRCGQLDQAPESLDDLQRQSPTPMVASVSTALDIIEEHPELRVRLWRNTHKMLRGYKTLGTIQERAKLRSFHPD